MPVDGVEITVMLCQTWSNNNMIFWEQTTSFILSWISYDRHVQVGQMATKTASFDSITWSEFLNGVSLNTNSYSSTCSCFKEPVINLNSTFLAEKNSGIVYDSKCGNRKCFAEYKEKHLAKVIKGTMKKRMVGDLELL